MCLLRLLCPLVCEATSNSCFQSPAASAAALWRRLWWLSLLLACVATGAAAAAHQLAHKAPAKCDCHAATLGSQQGIAGRALADGLRLRQRTVPGTKLEELAQQPDLGSGGQGAAKRRRAGCQFGHTLVRPLLPSAPQGTTQRSTHV